MNKLFEKKVEIKVTDGNISYSDDHFKIGGIKMTSEHEQNCCETVIADFSVFKHYINDIKKMPDVKNIRIHSVEGDGFVVFLEGGYNHDYFYQEKIGIFVPCYNQQNGCYDDGLDLVIEDENKIKTTIDLQEAVCVEDNID